MTLRYLKVDVERTHASTVYLVLDDEKCPMTVEERTLKMPPDSGLRDIVHRHVRFTPEIRQAAERAAEKLDEFDWGDDRDADVRAVNAYEVTEEEALQYLDVRAEALESRKDEEEPKCD